VIAAIDGWIKGVVFVVLFASFLDLLLPNSSMQKFVRVIMGLFIMMAVLTPVIDFVDKSPGNIEIPVGGEFADNRVLSSLSDAQESARDKRERLTREHYAKELERQIRATVLSIEGVADAKVVVRLKEISKHENETLKTRVPIPQIAQVDILVKPKNEIPPEEILPIAAKIDVRITNITIPNEKDDAGKNILRFAVKEKIERTISQLYYISPENIKIHPVK